MRIKKLHIQNFKSLVNFELEDLKPFCAFVGPNASGKSNIFEALEFTNYLIKFESETPAFFGGKESIYSYSSAFDPAFSLGSYHPSMVFDVQFEDRLNFNFVGAFLSDPNKFEMMSMRGAQIDKTTFLPTRMRNLKDRNSFIEKWVKTGNSYDGDYEQFADSFSRIFVGKSSLNRTPAINNKLSPDASNLAQIIGSIFESKERRNDFIEWLRILIPEFADIEVKKSNIDSSYDFSISEKGSSRPFSRNLISDGTYNILSLMAAVYQTNQPQFLCIEEPENGLHPQAIELLVDFFREKCEEEGHHIWLNTHSQTLVRCLEIDEIILVNKINGATRAKQLRKEDEVDIKTDEAWLSNALGGGVL